MSLVLASASATRVRLLTDAGVRFDAVRPGVDEEALKAALLAQGAAPRDVADALAEVKAMRVSSSRPGALVIGADQTLELEGELVSKPRDPAEARTQLQALRGRTHALHAAVVVARDGAPIWRELKTARLTVRDFSDAFLESYLAQAGEAVLGSVGGYHVEGLGLQLFSRIDGDAFTIMGLPMLGLLDLLRRHGELAA